MGCGATCCKNKQKASATTSLEVVAKDVRGGLVEAQDNDGKYHCDATSKEVTAIVAAAQMSVELQLPSPTREKSEKSLDTDVQQWEYSVMHAPLDVLATAAAMGLDICHESQLLWIAEQLYHADLPLGWQRFRDKREVLYYHNANSGATRWTHPLEDVFIEAIDYCRRAEIEGHFHNVDMEAIRSSEIQLQEAMTWVQRFDEFGKAFWWDEVSGIVKTEDPKHDAQREIHLRFLLLGLMKERFPDLAAAESPQVAQLELATVDDQLLVDDPLLCEVKERFGLRSERNARRLARSEAKLVRRRAKIGPLGQQLVKMDSIPGVCHGTVTLSMPLEARRELAATRIQRIFRGNMSRSMLAPQMRQHIKRWRSAALIQSQFRQWRSRFCQDSPLSRASVISHASQLSESVQSYWQCVVLIQRFIRNLMVRRRERKRPKLEISTSNQRDSARFIQVSLRSQDSQLSQASQLSESVSNYWRCVVRIQRFIRNRLVQRRHRKRRKHDLSKSSQPNSVVESLGGQCSNDSPHEAPICPTRVEARQAIDHVNATRNEPNHNGPRALARALFRPWRRWQMSSFFTLVCMLESRRQDAKLKLHVKQQAAATRIQSFARWSFVSKLRARVKEGSRVRLQEMRQQRAQQQAKAALTLQCCWRRYVANKICDSLREEVCWPLKAWIEFSTNASLAPQVEVRFLFNPAFDVGRYALSAYGPSMSQALDRVDDVVHDVEICSGKLSLLSETFKESLSPKRHRNRHARTTTRPAPRVDQLPVFMGAKAGNDVLQTQCSCQSSSPPANKPSTRHQALQTEQLPMLMGANAAHEFVQPICSSPSSPPPTIEPAARQQPRDKAESLDADFKPTSQLPNNISVSGELVQPQRNLARVTIESTVQDQSMPNKLHEAGHATSLSQRPSWNQGPATYGSNEVVAGTDREARELKIESERAHVVTIEKSGAIAVETEIDDASVPNKLHEAGHATSLSQRPSWNQGPATCGSNEVVAGTDREARELKIESERAHVVTIEKTGAIALETEIEDAGVQETTNTPSLASDLPSHPQTMFDSRFCRSRPTSGKQSSLTFDKQPRPTSGNQNGPKLDKQPRPTSGKQTQLVVERRVENTATSLATRKPRGSSAPALRASNFFDSMKDDVIAKRQARDEAERQRDLFKSGVAKCLDATESRLHGRAPRPAPAGCLQQQQARACTLNFLESHRAARNGCNSLVGNVDLCSEPPARITATRLATVGCHSTHHGAANSDRVNTAMAREGARTRARTVSCSRRERSLGCASDVQTGRRFPVMLEKKIDAALMGTRCNRWTTNSACEAPRRSRRNP